MQDFQSLFDKLHTAVEQNTRALESDLADRSSSILEKTATMRKLVNQKYSNWPEDLAVVATKALAVYRMRLIDMFIRERVLLVYIMECTRYLRVHRGIAYFYHEDGAIQPFKGVSPEATFGRVKQFLLRLEGLFRLLPASTRREDKALFDAMAAVAKSMRV